MLFPYALYILPSHSHSLFPTNFITFFMLETQYKVTKTITTKLVTKVGMVRIESLVEGEGVGEGVGEGGGAVGET
jgi:hypothetical protein